MNLITVLKKIIVTETKREKDRGTTLFSQVIDKKLVQLKSTYHQRKERFGKESYDDIVDMYNDYLSTRKSKYQQPPRLAVPDSMVKNLFSDSLEKIEVLRRGRVRRAKLFYLRNLAGKAARIKELRK